MVFLNPQSNATFTLGDGGKSEGENSGRGDEEVVGGIAFDYWEADVGYCLEGEWWGGFSIGGHAVAVGGKVDCVCLVLFGESS